MTKDLSPLLRVPDPSRIRLFRNRPGVWLTIAGSAYLELYAERLAPLGLRPHLVTALAIVAERPGITQSALARALAINRASAMATATGLETAGLFVRSSLPGRKATALHLTPKGHAHLIEACALETELTGLLLGDIPASEMAIFLQTLIRVTSVANKSPI